jgi:hypothetical protein
MKKTLLTSLLVVSLMPAEIAEIQPVESITCQRIIKK